MAALQRFIGSALGRFGAAPGNRNNDTRQAQRSCEVGHINLPNAFGTAISPHDTPYATRHTYSRNIASGGSLASRRVPSHPASITTAMPPRLPLSQMPKLA